MRTATRGIWKPHGWAALFVVSLALAGCGGDSTPSKSDADSKASSGPVTPPAQGKSQSKIKGKSVMAEGGELSREERRAAKLREKQAAAQ